MTQPPARTSEPDLNHYLGILARRKWLIATTVAVSVGITLAFAFYTPKVYEARSEVIINGETVVQTSNQTVSPPVNEQVDKERRLMVGSVSRDALQEALGRVPQVELTTKDGLARISIVAQADNPEEAAKEANDFAEVYVETREAQLDEDLVAATITVRAQVEGLDADSAAKSARIDEIDALLADPATSPEDASRLGFEKSRLETALMPATIAAREADIRSTLTRLNLQRIENRTQGTFTIARATPPTAPISPQPVLWGLIAAMTGLIVGVLIAFARDYYDDTMRTKEDLDVASSGVPVLGLIPAVEAWRDRDDALLESIDNPHSPASEAYRTLRTALAFASIERRMLIIQVTSSNSGEGKTTTSANLAVTLAKTGKQVVLVDCDLRRPRLHDFFGLSNDIGFASVLLGEVNVADALLPVPNLPGLHVLPSGPPPPNPAELLSTVAAKRLLEGMGEVADFVIVDSPPLLPVADATTLAGYADATILLVTARTTTKRSLKRSLEILEQVNAPLEGILFNGVGREATYSYGYEYTENNPRRSKRKAEDLPQADGRTESDEEPAPSKA